MHNLFQVGAVTIGGGDLFLTAGPCVIESEAHALHEVEEEMFHRPEKVKHWSRSLGRVQHNPTFGNLFPPLLEKYF